MNRPRASALTAVWIDDVQAANLRAVQGTQNKMLHKGEVKVNVVKHHSKEATVISTKGNLTSFQAQSTNILTGQPRMVTLPIGTTANTIKMSPYKTEPAILPKHPVHVPSSAPMILGSQRMVNIASGPLTAQGNTPMVQHSLTWSGKRLHDLSDTDFLESKRSKKGEKGGKGLRHFSMKVCEKVKNKGVTSYNEVADELVAEFSDPQRNVSPGDQTFDQKNIRRRVYDALNVLMAMNIISKEKKEIRWLGLPTNSAQECQNLEQERQKRVDRIRLKTQQLQETILQQIAFKNLVERNNQAEKQHGLPAPNTSIQLPFIIVNTDKKTVIDCSISNDKMEYLFNFNNTFEIHDDVEVLKRMGLAFSIEKGECSPEHLEKAKHMVSKALEGYVVQMAKGISTPNICSSITAGPSGIKAGNGDAENSGIKLQSLLLPSTLMTSDATEIDTSMSGIGGRALSRQSSATSLSDNITSRPESDTSSVDYNFTDMESDDESITIDTN